ncbi:MULTISPECIES: hypothetical protein [unclassified Bradyrhizobium]|uniref:hypothetical protein n=1 Tax=unclassified Bradyrhizobium TaxID=2631580 RepID=UPI002011A847|nr:MULTISPECIES: hypothetical protein [unclassified Bradyrhizobium]
MDALIETGIFVRDIVLAVASLLRQEFVPGLVSLSLLVVLIFCVLRFALQTWRRVAALHRLGKEITHYTDAAELSAGVTDVDRNVNDFGTSGAKGRVASAWREFRETLVSHEEDGQVILRNSVRPSAFFNVEDIGFSPGFWRYVPSLFVSVGLLLTFLGLVSALESIVPPKGEVIGNDQLSTLLSVASAKFIMSLTGLLCSILFTVVLRMGTARIDLASHDVTGKLEERLSFISLESLAIEQLTAVREQREHFRRIGLELVAELGRPLREDIPRAISSSIETAMAPLLAQVGKAGTEGVGVLVQDLSSRFTADVSQALGAASERLSEAGDRIAQLSERMDGSSTRVGQELDGVVSRIAQSMEAIQVTLTGAAESTGNAFNEGTEKLLAAMNTTLESIRDNTSEGARALSSAANDLKDAGQAFREQMGDAARDGSAAARARIEETGQQISRMAEELTSKASQQLMSPLGEIAAQMEQVSNQVAAVSGDLRAFSEGVRSGADATVRAAGAFRAASQDLVEAASPVRGTAERMEGALRHLAESTQSASSAVTRSAETTARSAADALAAAQAVMTGKAKAVESTLDGISVMLGRLKGQGDRIDDIDVKLGKAFDTYTSSVASAVDGMRLHVQELQQRLAPALDTLRTIVDQAEQFAPRSGRP